MKDIGYPDNETKLGPSGNIDNEDMERILSECKQLINNRKEIDAEMKASKEGIDFLIDEYKTNPRYFREEPGKVTVDDIIKTAFEFGWSSKRNFDYRNK